MIAIVINRRQRNMPKNCPHANLAQKLYPRRRCVKKSEEFRDVSRKLLAYPQRIRSERRFVPATPTRIRDVQINRPSVAQPMVD